MSPHRPGPSVLKPKSWQTPVLAVEAWWVQEGMDKKEGNHSSGSRTSGSRGKEVIDCSSRKPFNVQWVYNVNIMEGRSIINKESAELPFTDRVPSSARHKPQQYLCAAKYFMEHRGVKFEAVSIWKCTGLIRAHFPAAVLSLMQIIHVFPSRTVWPDFKCGHAATSQHFL